MYRFFLDDECGVDLAQKRVKFSAALSRHIRAARVGSREEFILVLPAGKGAYRARLDGPRAAVLGEAVRLAGPGPVWVELYLGLSKGDALEAAISGACEMGADALHLVECERSVAGPPSASRQERLQRIVQSAAEVAGRGSIPELGGAASFEEAAAAAGDADTLALVLWEEEAQAEDSLSLAAALTQSSPAKKILLFVGPEGGLSIEEVAALLKAGWRKVSLGPRILRARTAPVAALAVVQALVGDLK